MMNVMDVVGHSGEAGGARPAAKGAGKAGEKPGRGNEISPWSVALMSLLATDPPVRAGECGSATAGADESGVDSAAAVAGVTGVPEGAMAVAGTTALTAAPAESRGGTAGAQRLSGVGGLTITGEGGASPPFLGPMTPEAVATTVIPHGEESGAGDREGLAGGAVQGTAASPGNPTGTALPPTGAEGPAVAAGVAEAEFPVEVENGTGAGGARGAAGLMDGSGEVAKPADREHGGSLTGDAGPALGVQDEAVTGARDDAGGSAGIFAVTGAQAGEAADGAAGGLAHAGDSVAPAAAGENVGRDAAVPALDLKGERTGHGSGVSGEGAGQNRRVREKEQVGGSGEVKGEPARNGEFAADLTAAGRASLPEAGGGVTDGDGGRAEAQGRTGRVGIGEIGRQIVDRARVLKYPERTEVEISLKPESLGKVVMRISMRGERLSAKFEVTAPEVRSILETRMDELRKGLAERGLEVRDLSVSVGDGAGTRQYGQGARGGRQSPRRTGPAWIGRIPGEGLGPVAAKWRNLEERALDLMA